MIRFLRLVTRSLVLLLIALFSALTAMRLAIHGREVRVPKLVGMNVLQAQESANATGLTVVVEDKFYSAEVPAGRIISQAPAANNRVRRGWRVRVAESLGPQRVSIPDLMGETERAATINLRQRGLDLGTVAGVAVPNAPVDEVIAQVPPANAVDVSSPKVNILLAEPPPAPEYVMPNFVGRQLAEAREKIARAGLQIASVTVASNAMPTNADNAVSPTLPNPALPAAETQHAAPQPNVQNGKIVSQRPPAGSRVTPETQIRFEVAQ